MKKKNCWEFMSCGRQPGGRLVREQGICPAAIERKLDGIHGGDFGGRACWVIAGTLCKNEVQGTFARKYATCSQCAFYQHVKNDEHPYFRLAPTLLKMLQYPVTAY